MGSPWCRQQERHHVAASTRLGRREGHLPANLCPENKVRTNVPLGGAGCVYPGLRAKSLTFPHFLITHPCSEYRPGKG